MKTSATSVHIGRLVVEGPPGLDHGRFEASLRSELARLIAQGGIDARVASRARFDAGTIDLREVGDDGLGRDVARAAYAALGRPR